MSDPSQFEKHTHDALAHLYDLPYLRDHPLTRWLEPIAGAEAPGRVLRRIILDAIQDLKPPPDSPHDTAAAARYQFLYLRYVKGQSIDEIAKQLSLGERQLYRRQHDALEVVTSTLARKLRVPSGDDRGTDPVSEMADSAPGADATTRSEVDRIGTARPTTPTDLHQVLQGIVATVAQLTRADSRSLSVRLETRLRPIAADRVAVRQAILGLLMFAIESSIAGDIEVMAEQSMAGVDLRVGFPPKPGLDVDELLDGDGNLAVCRRLIALQGGTMRWQMKGMAFEFIVGLPFACPRSVLIVDDNTDTLQLFSRYLEAHAHRVLTASTGEEALRVVADEHPDAVVLDVMLPSADGYEALQSLRSDPVTADVPVVICTVLKQRDLALSLGATDFLPKPATQGDLLAALERCWARPR